jgi:Tol biopolymer transport system component
MSANGDRLHRLTGAAGWTDEAPVWSPDGGWVLFVHWRAQQDKLAEPTLWAVRADGSNAQRLAALSPSGGFQGGIGYWDTYGWKELFDVAP